MSRVIAMLALACAAVGVAPARAQEDRTPAVFCFEFDRLGDDGPDRIDGTSGADHIAAFGGDDHIHGFGGDDCVSGGAGNDELQLGPGDDEALGRGGHDLLEGSSGNDTLLGGLGADTLDGGEGDDVLVDDPVDRARDVIRGGPGNDRLHAGIGADVLDGGPGDDTAFVANGAIDRVDCGDGIDGAYADRGDVLISCERVVLGYRPPVRRTPSTGSRETTFRLSWDGGADVAVEPAGYAPARAGCVRGSWRISVAPGRARLRWVGRRRPCPGRYTWRVTRVATDASPDYCETAADAARGCARRETVGEASYTVAGSKP